MTPTIEPDGRDHQPVSQEQPLHLAGGRTKRHADADLAPALGDDIGDDAVDADHAEQQRHAGRDAENHQRERCLRHRLVVDLAQRAHSRQRQVRVDRPDGLLHLVEKSRRAEPRGTDGVRPASAATNDGVSQKSLIMIGQYTIVGAGWVTPSWRSLPTTPTISRHGFLGVLRMRRPTALAGSPQNSRAKFSLTITTGAAAWTSAHVIARPATSGLPIVSK